MIVSERKVKVKPRIGHEGRENEYSYISDVWLTVRAS